MDHDDTTIAPHDEAPNFPVPDLSQLPVAINIEIASTTMTLAAVDTLATGALIPIGGEPGKVSILAQGRQVATGRLVSLDGEAAVEVLEMTHHTHADDAIVSTFKF